MSRVARALKIGRSTLYRKLREYGLDDGMRERRRLSVGIEPPLATSRLPGKRRFSLRNRHMALTKTCRNCPR